MHGSHLQSLTTEPGTPGGPAGPTSPCRGEKVDQQLCPPHSSVACSKHQEDLLCAPPHTSPSCLDVPHLEYSRSSASNSHLTLKLRCHWRTRAFSFPLCAHSDQGLSSSCVRCVASIYCSRNSAGPPFWGYLMQQAVLEAETTGFLPLQ